MPWYLIILMQRAGIGCWEKKDRQTDSRGPLSLNNYFLKLKGSKCSYLNKIKIKVLKGCHHSNYIKPPWTKYPNCGCLNTLKHCCT